MTWTDDVARYLLDVTACPRCNTRTWNGVAAMRGGVCARCGADLSGAEGAELWQASELVVAAVRRRQALVDALPTASRAGVSRLAAAPDAAARPPATAAARTRSAISLQSVLAVVGAGLLAVAAIVFTFLNPELTDFATRTAIIALVTAVFLGGAWVLRTRGLRFSAEAIGALGMVFVALDVWAFSRVAPPGTSAWFFGALGLAVSGGAMLAAGGLLRMRTWLWAGVVALAIVPALVGVAIEQQLRSDRSSGWATTWGPVAVVFAGWGLLELLRPLSARFASALRADRITITVIQGAALVIAVPAASLIGLDGWRYAPAIAFAALALAALLTTRAFLPALWSAAGGVLGTLAAAWTAGTAAAPSWAVAVVPAAAAAVLVLLATMRRTGSVRRLPLVAGAVSVAALTTVPALLSVIASALSFPATTPSLMRVDSVTSSFASVLGLLALAAGLAALARSAAHGRARTGFAAASAWVAASALLGVPFAIPGGGLPLLGAQLALGALAAGAALGAAMRRAPRWLRAPLIASAQLMPVQAALFSWPVPEVASVVGPLAVAVLALSARSVPQRFRPIHTAVGFGYLLVIGSVALGLTMLAPLPILCLVTAGAAVVAIVASLTSWLPVGSWYALLGVTSVPFAIGVVSVLIERSGWTALSTALIFLLATSLLLTRRPGTGMMLRAFSAALLVPTLAVVVVCLTAELPQSGSPYALPIIAVLAACALPTSGLVHAVLAARGDGAASAAAARLAIEVSALVTGAIAVVLALSRAAAGFEIAFLVLLILGLGGAATALWTRRRYGWWTASAAWTGALWCAWAIIGVTVIEPYLLPPAVAAITVGTVLVSRRGPAERARSAAALFATGLGVAIAPSLVILALADAGFDRAPGRVLALLAGAVALTVIAALVTRPAGARPTRFERIRVPLLAGAVLAAAAGVVQGVRFGAERDPLPFAGAHPMTAVLMFAVIATAVAAAVAHLAQTAGTGSRRLYAPAMVFLVVGPMTAVAPDPASIWTLWCLELLLLGAMVATVWRARGREPRFPPVWFHWSLAWIVAVVAWSPREVLRVEGFAVPLGLALVLVGAISLVRGPQGGGARTFTRWPVGYRGSWWLLAPGIVATLLPSILATFTDPQTWRAILVIALALVAVLVGARRTLAAPFVIGISVLPLEILIVFLVQLGDAINPLLWWITLATAGAVLLVIAVGWERRTGADASLGARIRDLR